MTEKIEIPKGALKFVNDEFVIYRRDFLYKNLEMEIDLLRKYKRNMPKDKWTEETR